MKPQLGRVPEGRIVRFPVKGALGITLAEESFHRYLQIALENRPDFQELKDFAKEQKWLLKKKEERENLS